MRSAKAIGRRARRLGTRAPRARQAAAKVLSKSEEGWRRASIEATRLADRAERLLPAWGRRRLAAMRPWLSPFALTDFARERAKQDPLFLPAFLIGSSALSWTLLPVSITVGAGPMTVAALQFITGPALNSAALLWREVALQKRQNPNVTAREALVNILSEVPEFHEKHLARNRRAD